MTSSPSEIRTPEDYATLVSETLGVEASAEFGTVKAKVASDDWVDTLRRARDELDLVYLSFLSAIDWANEVEVGDPPANEVEERYEVLCAVGDSTSGQLVVFSTDLAKDAASVASLIDVYPGANWHEREAHEMFDIDFIGHPNLVKLYLPSDFAGHPLQKSYPLIAREVKPWPGDVDVEDKPEGAAGGPSLTNPEA